MGREFTRQELYDLVWREPLRTLAKALHISDVRLAKICRRAIGQHVAVLRHCRRTRFFWVGFDGAYPKTYPLLNRIATNRFRTRWNNNVFIYL
jgi:hypothetical protein